MAMTLRKEGRRGEAAQCPSRAKEQEERLEIEPHLGIYLSFQRIRQGYMQPQTSGCIDKESAFAKEKCSMSNPPYNRTNSLQEKDKMLLQV
jgi:hypothetical protein